MSDMDRRQALGMLGAMPVAAAFTWTPEEAVRARALSDRARAQASVSRQAYVPRFFTADEYATVVALADMIIPPDAVSGGASDAGAPEFIDYIVAEQPARQTALRGGLAWLDTECRRRSERRFLDCSDAERREVLDDIAWPRRAPADMSHGVTFFTTMRDLVATGFWSSRVGVEDLGYLGNQAVAGWTGAPSEVLARLGVRYD